MTQLLSHSTHLHTSVSYPQDFFALLFGTHMKQVPKRPSKRSHAGIGYDPERQWVFVGNKERMICVATHATLNAIVSDPEADTPYYTPNGYYRRGLRLTETLRWLRAFVFDVDQYGESIPEVLERIDRAGLPRPTAITGTPNGGHHVTYMFTEPVRATPRAVRLYSAIMSHMAIDLGADLAAVGANRIYRTPTQDNLLYFDPESRYGFDTFKEWRELNHPYDPESAVAFVNVELGDVMSHPALQYLLEAPCVEGNREKTALTLALAMKASEWPQTQAEAALRAWYVACCEKGSKSGKKPFTERDAVYKAGYVNRKDKLHAPKAEIVRELTGMPFYYRSRLGWNSAKPRTERERVHLDEWEADYMTLLEAEREISGTQQELAERLSCPLASFKVVLGRLKENGKVNVETRKGRCGKTVIQLNAPKQDKAASGDSRLSAEPIQTMNVVYVDFRNWQVTPMERRPEATPPDPEPPD